MWHIICEYTHTHACTCVYKHKFIILRGKMKLCHFQENMCTKYNDIKWNKPDWGRKILHYLFCGFLSPSCRLSDATAMNVAWRAFLSPSNQCSIQVSLRKFDPRKHMNIQETKSKATRSGREWGYWILVNKWGAQTTERRWVTGIFEFRRKTDSLESIQKVS